MKLYHTFFNSSYIYLTRNNHSNCSPNLVPTNPLKDNKEKKINGYNNRDFAGGGCYVLG